MRKEDETQDSEIEPGMAQDSNAQGKSQINPDPQPPGEDESPGDSKEKGENAAGVTFAVLATNTLTAAFGERWEPTDAETESLKFGFSAFFNDRGIENIPANISAFVGVAGYLLPRFVKMQKEARERRREKEARPANPIDPATPGVTYAEQTQPIPPGT